jgi:hypothetical protein
MAAPAGAEQSTCLSESSKNVDLREFCSCSCHMNAASEYRLEMTDKKSDAVPLLLSVICRNENDP